MTGGKVVHSAPGCSTGNTGFADVTPPHLHNLHSVAPNSNEANLPFIFATTLPTFYYNSNSSSYFILLIASRFFFLRCQIAPKCWRFTDSPIWSAKTNIPSIWWILTNAMPKSSVISTFCWKFHIQKIHFSKFGNSVGANHARGIQTTCQIGR